MTESKRSKSSGRNGEVRSVSNRNWGQNFNGECRRNLALPLGGIGTGHIALSGDGSFRQWQLANVGNHRGYAPGTFFAIRTSAIEPPRNETRLIQSMPLSASINPAPGVTDQLVPDAIQSLVAFVDPLELDEVWVSYPVVRLPFAATELGLFVTVAVFSPFKPLDAKLSGMPGIIWEFELENISGMFRHGFLGGSILNSIGWDGVSPIDGVVNPGFGGNRNQLFRDKEWTGLELSSQNIGAQDSRFGELVFAANGAAAPLAQSVSEQAVIRWLNTLKLLRSTITGNWSDEMLARAVRTQVSVHSPERPSSVGQSWMGALALPFALKPGERKTLRFQLSWRFPNRYADFDQFGATDNQEPIWLGNWYATEWSSARTVQNALATISIPDRSWSDIVWDSDLPDLVKSTLNSMPAYVRSPTIFRDAKNHWLAFEGVLGESTLNWNGDVGGSCPLNCTHVLNYEVALSRLFPEADRSMRDIEWTTLQAPEGYLPHRLRLPMDGPQFWGEIIGGPDLPAIDGMLGAVLKTLRYVQSSGDIDWLTKCFDNVLALVEYVRRAWDPATDGVLVGLQPVTYDIPLTGANMMVGSLWICALHALHELGNLVNRSDETEPYSVLAQKASNNYNKMLWNGEYYAQRSADADYDFGTGCLTDQLLGQWWAFELNLGYILPRERVESALKSILKYNLRGEFNQFNHGYRTFADGDDLGVVICSWPKGGRPKVPIRYADEVWTGVEYQLAALCFSVGLTNEGYAVLSALRARYDGTRRNPFNEIECGDHYARAMAGWSLLAAYSGVMVNVCYKSIRISGRLGTFPILCGTGYGEINIQANSDGDFVILLAVLSGYIDISVIQINNKMHQLDKAIRVEAIEDQPHTCSWVVKNSNA